MYRRQYEQVLVDDQGAARRREHDAFCRVVDRLERAAESGAREGLEEALDAHDLLWSILLADLSGPDNLLPRDLRERLVSIGMWASGEAVRLRRDGGAMTGLIDVNRMIRDGLRPRPCD